MCRLARLALILVVVAPSFVGYGQDPPRPKAKAERSPEWVLQIASDADFDFADRDAALQAAKAVVGTDGRFSRDVRVRALKILFYDARYQNRKSDAAAVLKQLREISPDDPEAALRHIQQGGIDCGEEIRLRIRELEEYVQRFSASPPALAMMTDLLISDGRATDAMRKLDVAIKQHPKNGLFLSSRAATLHAQGEARKALEDLDASLACEPQVRFVNSQYMSRAEVLYSLNRPDEALSCCAMALQLQPPHVDAHAYVCMVSQIASRCYQSLGKNELAYFVARILVKSAPQLPESWQQMAETCVFSGRYEEGTRALDRLATLAPPSARASFLGARLRSGMGDELGALAATRNGLKTFPTDADLTRLECLLLATAKAEEVRDAKKAKAIAGAALAGPGGADPQWLFFAALAYAADEDYAAATDLLAKADAATRGTPGPRRRLLEEAMELVRKKQRVVDRMPDRIDGSGDDVRPRVEWINEITSDWDYDLMPVEMAVRHCQTVVADESLDLGLRIKAIEVLTRLRHRQGKAEDARRGYATLVKIASDNAAYRRGQVSLDHSGKEPQEQAKAWEQFCAEFPTDVEGRAQWAYEVLRSGDPGRAEEIIAVAGREATEHPRMLHVKALAAHRRGKHAESIDLLNRWLCRPDEKGFHALAYLLRADSLTRLDRFDAALANLSIALRLAPNRAFLGPIYCLASICYMHQDKSTIAFQVASRWAAAGLNQSESHLAAATAAILGDDLENAANSLDRALQSGSASRQANLVKAVLKQRQGDEVDCKSVLDRGLATWPESEANKCALAVHLTFATDEKVRDVMRAIEIAKTGVASGSALRAAWCVCLANAYAETGEFNKAIETLNEHNGTLDEQQLKLVREVFKNRLTLRHHHDISKWIHKQLLLNP